MNTKTKEITLIGLMTALMCIAGPLSLPLPTPVPVSLGLLAIYFAIYMLGMKRSAISCVVYLMLGFAGLPVFTGFTGGPMKFMGPTGGYMIGYIFLALIGGCFVDKWNGNIAASFIGMVLGTAVCYMFGTAWLAYQTNMSFAKALTVGVLPFILGDIIKLTVSLLIGSQVRIRVRNSVPG